MTQTIFNHVCDQVEEYYKLHNREPRFLWMALDAYRAFIISMNSSMRITPSTFNTHQDLISRNTRISFNTESLRDCLVNVYAVKDLESGEILTSHDKNDLYNYIAERELLCDTTGALTADTVTILEKTEKEASDNVETADTTISRNWSLTSGDWTK